MPPDLWLLRQGAYSDPVYPELYNQWMPKNTIYMLSIETFVILIF